MNTNNRIPKQTTQGKTVAGIIPKASLFKHRDEGLKFSFEALDYTEYFSLDGTCPNWASDLFKMLKDISGHSVIDMVSGEYKRKYRVHNHENATPPSKLPDGVALKDCYQIRIETSKGGIHGVFIENVFYVIWLDPLHNMYPKEHFGGLRKIKPASTCCMDRDNELVVLQERIRTLEEENRTYAEMFENA